MSTKTSIQWPSLTMLMAALLLPLAAAHAKAACAGPCCGLETQTHAACTQLDQKKQHIKKTTNDAISQKYQKIGDQYHKQVQARQQAQSIMDAAKATQAKQATHPQSQAIHRPLPPQPTLDHQPTHQKTNPSQAASETTKASTSDTPSQTNPASQPVAAPSAHTTNATPSTPATTDQPAATHTEAPTPNAGFQINYH